MPGTKNGKRKITRYTLNINEDTIQKGLKMICNEKSICCQKSVKEKWKGLRLFHKCKNCGNEYLKGRFVYYNEGGINSENITENYQKDIWLLRSRTRSS